MLIKELFEKSCEKEYKDLQALIMFLVFEKEVLSMGDDTKELDIYFLEKHNKRMNKELASYRKKMNISYGLRVYEITDNDSTFYVLAKTETQAKFLANRNLIQVKDIKTCSAESLMHHKGNDITLKELIKDRQPCVLGGHKH